MSTSEDRGRRPTPRRTAFAGPRTHSPRHLPGQGHRQYGVQGAEEPLQGSSKARKISSSSTHRRGDARTSFKKDFSCCAFPSAPEKSHSIFTSSWPPRHQTPVEELRGTTKTKVMKAGKTAHGENRTSGGDRPSLRHAAHILRAFTIRTTEGQEEKQEP